MDEPIIRLTLNERQATLTNEALLLYTSLRNGDFTALTILTDKLPNPVELEIKYAAGALTKEYDDQLSFDAPDPSIVEGDNDLTEAEASFVDQALDAYSRLISGQTQPVERLLRHRIDPEFFDRKTVRAHVESLKRAFVPKLIERHRSPHVNHGIHSDNVSDDARIAYDVHQVLRQAIAFLERPEGGIEVSFDSPVQFGEEPLASASYIGDDKQTKQAEQARREQPT